MKKENLKSSTEVPYKPTKRKKVKRHGKVYKVFRFLMMFLLSVFLIIIISGSILVTALTIYILNFADTTSTISLDNIEVNFTTRFLAENPEYDKEDETSEEYVLYYSLNGNGEKRTWVDIEDIPMCVREAFVSTEDENFYTHDGVDFKRTLGAFINVFIPIYSSNQGGSTITQQLIKNITGDDAQDGGEGYARKIREIFRSINLEKTATKDDILEAYLNIVPLGNNVCGVQAAVNYYFSKDVSELSVKEAASLAAITRAPALYNPVYDYDMNVGRANDFILQNMLDYGAISTTEYLEALEEELVVTGDSSYTSAVDSEDNEYEITGVTSYYIDAAINDAIAILEDEEGIDYDAAEEKLLAGGYTIYTNVDLEMQSEVESKFLDYSTFAYYTSDDDTLKAAFIAMDYNGNVKAVVGDRGEKTVSRSLSYATMARRSPGSSIKPIASYAPALDKDLITYSTIFKDEPIEIENEDGELEKWPVNYSEDGYSENWSYNNYFTFEMIYKSLNTAPAQIVQELTPTYCFNFLQDTMHLTSLVANEDGKTDDAYSPMVVGEFTYGVYLDELVAAYQTFGNQGMWYKASFVNKIVDKLGNVVYENQYVGEQAIDSSTGYVMNRMLEHVITNSSGTGRYAKLENVDLVGKTGTSNEWQNLTFVGCTPEYVSGVWIGYELLTEIDRSQYKNIGAIWKNIFGEIADAGTVTEFTMPDTVVELKYCTKTGLIAGSNCYSTATGYYKDSNIPETCSGNH
ncbi:MAG: transglycosylase domain-containing protein [Ruminococcus sp.]|nr:transglycosylase domain-containing protein [Ruminococcus sp.]